MKAFARVFLTAALAAAAVLHAAPKPGDQAPNFALADIDGTVHRPADLKNTVVVLEWTNLDCPFVRRHYGSGGMQALQAEYTAKGVVWYTICSSAPGKQGNYSATEWRDLLAAKSARCTALLPDPDGTVGKAYGATATPHIFVLGRDGKLVYAGAPDDNASWKDRDGVRSYLREALDAALSGTVPEVTETRPYGCAVKY